jgi:hypothetical protein
MRVFNRSAALGLFCVFAISTVVQGQTPPSAFCTPKDAAIYFGNGVNTTRTQAKRALTTLENELHTFITSIEFERLEFVLAYNTTGGFADDLLESVIQDLQTDVTLFWRILSSRVPMPNSFRDKLLALAAAVDEAALANNQDLAIHVTSYKNKILEGKKVVLVSHSQGNFFANQAYGNLSTTERSSFGITSVANPDATVASGGPYTTLYEDLVILAIRVAKHAAGLPEPLPPNITNFFTLADLSGHGFVEAYLAPSSASRDKVLNDIVNVDVGLLPPPSTGGQGVITVTLTWGAQPDVDLHAFEPNGTHVYYANLFGPSGYLDVDDVTSFGPEHYFVSCNTLESGTYRIGVNYYYGTAPEVASVLMQAGLESKGLSVFLPTALGSSGNASPVSVGNIVVTGNSTDGFAFEIQ